MKGQLLATFSDLQAKELERNQWKGETWLEDGRYIILERLSNKFTSLKESVLASPTFDRESIRKCVDLGNYSAMLADILSGGELSSPPNPEEGS